MNPNHPIPPVDRSFLSGKTGDEALDAIIRRIHRADDFPAISSYLIEINRKLSTPDTDSSASDLANVILKDYALTSKMLKLVNSAFYGFVAGKVTTVTRAVVILGLDNVRMLAVGLVLFDHFRSRFKMQDLKAAVNCSFWRGMVAREIAMRLSLADPEETFICALLYQLGKMLTIFHMPETFNEIKRRIAPDHSNERSVVRQILGVPYRAVGTSVAREWGLPKTICDAMAPIPPERLERKTSNLSQLNILANFTDALGRIIITVPLSKREGAIKDLLHRYRHHLVISEKQLREVWTASLEGVDKHAEALQLDTQNCEFLQRLADPLKRKKSDAPDKAQSNTYQLFSSKALQAPADTLNDPVSIIMDGIQDIAAVMTEDHNLNDVALMSIEIMYRALQSNRVIMFINESKQGLMEARYGYGPDIERYVGDLKFKIDSAQDLFSQSIASGQDLMVADSHSPDLLHLIPPWYKAGINARSFIFLPVMYKSICIGAFYADYGQPGLPVNPLEHKYLALLRNQLVLAIKLSK
jgi:eukaryotic-like serine/threonine-protein kinase